MKFIPMLRQNLKSDAMLDLLDTYDMEVIYEFDRTYENMPDQYWTKCLELGLQLLFDADQSLQTIFINLTDADGFTPADLADSDVLPFNSKKSAASYALQQGVATSEGRAELFGVERDWIRLNFEGYSIHYEYRLGSLALVTVTSKW